MNDAETNVILKLDGREATEEEKADIVEMAYIDNDEEHADDLQLMTREERLLSGVSELAYLCGRISGMG